MCSVKLKVAAQGKCLVVRRMSRREKGSWGETEAKVGNVGGGCRNYTSPAKSVWIGERVGSHVMAYINHSHYK